MHPYTPENSISDGPVTNRLSTLCILLEVLSPTHAKEGKSHTDFRFGIFDGRSLSDTLASMAVKGLRKALS